jgi:hypothetical protein
VKYKYYMGLISLLFLLSILLASCAQFASDYRSDGFHLMQTAFESCEAANDLNMVVELKNVRVHIVGDRKYFEWKKAAAYDSRMLGYATTGNEIFVFGRKLGNKIVVNQAILGHELNHLLKYQNPIVANPDRLDTIEHEIRASGR